MLKVICDHIVYKDLKRLVRSTADEVAGSFEIISADLTGCPGKKISSLFARNLHAHIHF